MKSWLISKQVKTSCRCWLAWLHGQFAGWQGHLLILLIVVLFSGCCWLCACSCWLWLVGWLFEQRERPNARGTQNENKTIVSSMKSWPANNLPMSQPTSQLFNRGYIQQAKQSIWQCINQTSQPGCQAMCRYACLLGYSVIVADYTRDDSWELLTLCSCVAGNLCWPFRFNRLASNQSIDQPAKHSTR